MKKQILFKVLFLSWLSGIFLICLFPPIPDFQLEHEGESFISQDSLPEFHQRNTSQSKVFQVDLGFELQGDLPFRLSGFQSLHSNFDIVKQVLRQIYPLFNVRVLFKAFFETW